MFCFVKSNVSFVQVWLRTNESYYYVYFFFFFSSAVRIIFLENFGHTTCVRKGKQDWSYKKICQIQTKKKGKKIHFRNYPPRVKCTCPSFSSTPPCTPGRTLRRLAVTALLMAAKSGKRVPLMNITLLEQPPYSPDLVPCDFFSFSPNSRG